MISVDEALGDVFDLIAPLGHETVPLREAAGRVLAADIVATRNQPPFAASVMDGYAVRDEDVRLGTNLRVIGEAAAGRGFTGAVSTGEAVRIFTGAPMPQGANRVVIQEDVERDGDSIRLAEKIDDQAYIRPVGMDFESGDRIGAGVRLTSAEIALAASMNAPMVTVARRPAVALIATGDELVMPGETPNDDQIIASNGFGLSALLEAEGADCRMLPIARDTEPALKAAFELAASADLVVTIGGASVGDHDLVGKVAGHLGMDRSFYKVRMRPGKPLMAGHISGTPMIGLPGNPVSSMVCGHVFLRPAIRAMLGLGKSPLPRGTAPLAAAIPRNGPREHYMRALRDGTAVRAFDRQDSSLLSVLAAAHCLIVRAPEDPARMKAEMVEVIDL